MYFRGNRDDDSIEGSAGDDVFGLGKGGNDSAYGGTGNDVFKMHGAFNAADHIDGGADFDEIQLDGDYSAGLTLGADTIVGIERIRLTAGHDYDLTMNDGNVAKATTLVINAGPLTSDDHFTFDGSAELDGSFTIFGGDGDDDITAGAQDDVVGIGQGGSDTVHGGGGDDKVYLDGAFDAGDAVDGGGGRDTAVLFGFYGDTGGGANPFVITGEMLTDVEELFLRDGFYLLLMEDGVVKTGETLTVNGSHVATYGIFVDASSETDGSYHFIGGALDDTLNGGAGNDVFDLNFGGYDTVYGGGGDDTFNFLGRFDSDANGHVGDHIDGGTGFDTVALDGDYFVQLLVNSFTSVERLLLTGNHDYNFVADNGNVAAGRNMDVDASALSMTHRLIFSGSNETNGTWTLIGGAGNDELYGGAGADTFQGDGQSDVLVGNGGSDTFVYAQVSDSTGPNFDSIIDIDFSSDIIQTDLGRPNAIDPAISDALMNADHFNARLEAIVTAAHLGVGNAVLVGVDDGEFAGRTLLIIDHNGVAGYQANQDYVIDVTDYSGVLSTSSFAA